MASVVTSRHPLHLHVIRRASNPFVEYSRTQQAGTERALGIDGLPDPFVHNEPPRSLEYAIEDTPFGGDESCPCIDISEATVVDALLDLLPPGQAALPYQNISSYGYGCLQHDYETVGCINVPIANQPAWCNLKWCWVKPSTCRRKFSPSAYIRRRAYSYSTCRNSDVYEQAGLLSALNGATLKVGLNSNTGGWIGAYSNDSSHWYGPLERWYGPMISFLREASAYSNFSIELVVPPQMAQNRSNAYFNGTSSFDTCVYAAALGIVDFCVSAYTLSTARAGAVDWMILAEQEIWLVTQVQGIVVVTDWFSLLDKLAKSFEIITQPFETNTWLFLILCVIPVMGIIFIIHEYGRPGSAYEVGETEVIQNDDGTKSVTYTEFSMWSHLGFGLYKSFLSVLQGGYEETVVSTGGFIHLLGVSFLIMTIIAVYTANMAAILTDRATQGDVNSIIRARRADYRFCADRSTMRIALKYYPNLLREDLFVIDHDDGLPGFASKRSLALDHLHVALASKSTSYCHAAIIKKEDLEYEAGLGRHCNKSIVGSSLGLAQLGFPLSERYSTNLKALFSQLSNRNVLPSLEESRRPKRQCSAVDPQIRGEEKSLSIEQLAGIWFVTFGFAGMGLFIHFFKPWRPITVLSKNERNQKKHEDAIRDRRIVRENSTFQRLAAKMTSSKTHHGSIP